MTKVLFVCLGNICRSPTAEGVFRGLVERRGLGGRIEIDSAGTSGWHIGVPPDTRAQAEAKRRGLDISGLRSRKVAADDFVRFDYIIAMDRENLADLAEQCPPLFRDRLHLFTEFAANPGGPDVPDPYYGGPSGFMKVFDLVTECSEGLLARILAEREKD